MVRSSVFAALILLVGVALSSPSVAQSMVRIPGTRVLLTVPDSFEVGPGGLSWGDAGASVAVHELPAPPESVRRNFEAGALAAQGMVLTKSEWVDSAMGRALLVHITHVVGGTPSVQGIEFRKWALVAGDDSGSVLIVAEAPVTLADELEPQLRQVLLTAQWQPGAETDPVAAAGFTVNETEDLKFYRSVLGSALVLTKGGELMGYTSEPMVFVTRSATGLAFTDPAAFSRQHLNETSRISAAKIEQEAELVVDGMPAYELVATAIAEPSLPPVVVLVVYQVVVVDEPPAIFLIQARVGADQRDRYLDQFREIARSLTVRR